MNSPPPLILPELRQRLEPMLLPGERIVWAAKPLRLEYGLGVLVLGAGGIGVTIVGLGWIVFVIRMMGGFPGLNVVSCVPLFGIVFVVAGTGMIAGSILFARADRNTAYAITDRRAIIAKGTLVHRSSEHFSYAPDRLVRMFRIERADLSGDLIFEQFEESFGSGTRTVQRGFKAIERVREVEELMIRTLLMGRVRPIEG